MFTPVKARGSPSVLVEIQESVFIFTKVCREKI